MTDPDSTMQGTTVDAGQAPPAETQDPAVEPESFDADYVRKLRAEAAQLSIQLAEELLKRNITIADHENMVKEYLDKVVIKH